MKIYIKTPEELEIMRHAGKILQIAQESIKKAIKPGVTLLELDKVAEDTIRREGGIPAFKGLYGFPATLCTMINSEVVHGIPDDRKVKEGDLLSVDCGVLWKNMFSDAAFTVIVGGEKTNKNRAKFSTIVREALLAGCRAAKTGNTTGDIGYIIEKTIRAGGYSICKEYSGHGLGYALHEDPSILNYGKPGMGTRLVTGMTIAIEPIVASGNPKCRTLSDQWTVVTADGHDACQWEHCGVVTPDGLEIFA